MNRIVLAGAFLVFVLATPPARADEPFLLKNNQRVVFLGDSNTFAGHFIAYLDGYLRTRFPDRRFDLINLGLPSETVSGLSEPDHPYPRPDVHERLERALAKTKPDVVVIGYGMNDGIYHPFSEERFARYRAGIEDVVRRARRDGAEVILLTPAPFDPRPVRKRVLPATAAKLSYMKPYEKYDEVLKRYADWLRDWGGKQYPVADAHGAIHRYLAAVRKDRPDLVLSGDGIHPNATGHALVALELLRALNAPAVVDLAEIDAARRQAVRGDVFDLRASDAGLRFAWKTRVPLPTDPQWDPRVREIENVGERFNRHRLKVVGMPGERYELLEEGKVVGTVPRDQLAQGIDLTRFADLSTNRRSAEAGKLIQRRQKLLGLAWLSDVGHKRPDTPKGLPLADAQQQAEQLDRQIRELVRPRAIQLELRRK